MTDKQRELVATWAGHVSFWRNEAARCLMLNDRDGAKAALREAAECESVLRQQRLVAGL